MAADLKSILERSEAVFRLKPAELSSYQDKAKSITGRTFYPLGVGFVVGATWRLPGLSSLPVHGPDKYRGVVPTLTSFLQEHLLPMLQPFSFLENYPRRELLENGWDQRPYTDSAEIEQALTCVKKVHTEAHARMAAQQLIKEDTSIQEGFVHVTSCVLLFTEALQFLQSCDAPEDEWSAVLMGAYTVDSLLWMDPKRLDTRLHQLLWATCRE